MRQTIDGVFVEVTGDEDLPMHEIRQYLFYLRNKNKNRTLDSLTINVDGEYVDLRYRFVPMKFERIRRITGYLVGSIDRWNNAKQAEERDRVKHI